MALPVQKIFSDNPGTLPATYELPPSLDLVVSSIRARINGASASAAFVPCLSILTQDDKLIARVRLDQEFAVGDTGEGTWAPFLRRTAAAIPTTGGVMAVASLFSSELVVGATRTVAWDTFTRTSSAIFATAATNGGADNDAPGDEFIKGKATGVYTFVVAIKPDTSIDGQQVDVVSFSSSPLTDHNGYPGDIVAAAVADDALEVDVMFLDLAGGAGYWTIELSNGGGSDIEVNAAVLYSETPALAPVF